jgi:cytochrome c
MRRFALTAALLFAAAAPALAQAPQATEIAPGQRLFRAQCGACHSVEAGKAGGVGPNLHGIMGRRAGQQAGFRYSAGMQAKAADASFTWTAETMAAYIENPRVAVPNGNMPYAGLRNPEQRTQLVEWLATQK